MATARLAVRIGIALAVAGVVLVSLNEFVTANEAGARQGDVAVPEATVSAVAQLGFPLAPIDGSLLLAARIDAVPSDVAPVLQLLADGTLVVRRHALAPQGPVAMPRQTRDGIGAAMVLPRELLDPGRASARGALLEVLGAWLPERPLPPARLRLLDLGLGRGELDRLCGWLP